MRFCKKFITLGFLLSFSFGFMGCNNLSDEESESTPAISGNQGSAEIAVAPPPVGGIVPVDASIPVAVAPVPVPVPALSPIIPTMPIVAPLFPPWGGGGHGDHDTDGGSDHEKECHRDSECEDDDPCTVDTCKDGTCECKHIRGCESCLTDSDCSEGSACTIPTCEDNICTYPSIPSCELVSITVTPTNPSIADGTTHQFIATGNYSDNTTQDITNLVVWDSSNTVVASISNSSGSKGLALGLDPGQTTISASLNGVSGNTTLTVTNATLLSIAITPVALIKAISMPDGTTRQVVATGTYSDATTQDLTNLVTWDSSDPSVATVTDTPGSKGLITAINPGVAIISGTLGAISGHLTVTVTPATLVSIAVTPPNPSIADGTNQQFVATGTFSDSTTQNITTQVIWSSTNPGTATISNVAGSEGLATAVNPGLTTITATFGAVSGNTTLTVSPAILVSIAVTPTNPSIADGTNQQFTATGTYSDTTTQNITATVTWGSSAPAVATISNAVGSKGLATSVDPGLTTISATLGAISGNTTLTVTPAVLVSIAVTPTNPSIADGTTQQFTATGTYSDTTTQNITATVTWGSSAPLVATISNAVGSKGLATSVDPGLTTISATLGAISGNTTLTVTPAVLVSIAVTPTNPSIADGTAQQFTATGTYSDSSTQNLTTTVTWASDDLLVATISNAAGTEGLATGVDPGTANITATLGAISGGTTLTVTPAVLVSIAVTPTNPSIADGTAQQFTATGTYSDSSTQNLTTTVTWATDDLLVATISNAAGTEGLATGVDPGTANITATLGAISGGTTLTVTPAVLVSIAVTPTNPSIADGTTQQFTATGTYSDSSTQNLTTTVTWASDDLLVATISNAAGTEGLATGVDPGTANITATLGAISGGTTLTVTPAVLVSIAVTPTNPSIADGTTQQFTATGTYSDSSTQNLTTAVTWASDDLLVATISNAAGTEGLATGVDPGTANITATLGAISGGTTLTVTPAVLVSIAVTPTNPSIADGTTQQFTATGTYSDSSTQNLTTTVTWASDDLLVATISNAAGTEGLATGVDPGTANITATLGAISGGTTLTVTPAVLVSIAVTPTNPSIADGTTQQFTATGTYSDSSTQNLTTTVTWASDDLLVATISNAAGTEGLATGVDPGTANITATLGAISGGTTLTVTAAVLLSIAVTPTNPSIADGTTQQFTATGTYSDSSTQNLTTTVTWASDDLLVATISNAAGTEGLATGVDPGTANITATLGAISGGTTLTVTAAVLVSIAVTPTNPSIADGTTQQFTATGTYSDSSTQNLTTAVTWASDDLLVATISNAAGTEGLATGVDPGTANITATLGAISGGTTLTVTPAVLVSIAVMPTNPSIADGTTQQFTATGTYSDSSTQNLTTAVTWASDDLLVATISNAAGTEGLATGVDPGTANITATLGAISGGTTLTVTPAVLVSIAVMPTNPSIADGTTQQFTATGTYSDSSTQNLTTAVTWASDDLLVATISNAAGTEGLATGVDPGTANITATLGAISGGTTLTVTPAVLVSLAIAPVNPSIADGATQQFTATGTYSDTTTQDLTTSVTWASDDLLVATISNAVGTEGLATGVDPGTANITATLGAISDQTLLTVTP